MLTAEGGQSNTARNVQVRGFKMAGRLSLVPYDPDWPGRFEAEAARLRSALDEALSAIEHVGSTAIPGVPGKPVLDIAVAVTSECAADECIKPLKELGYEYRGPYGDDPRRRYYVRDENGARVVQIHLYVLPAAAWDEKLAFRDALRADPVLASAYATEKYRVANEVAWDKAEYAVAKAPFVERVLSALRERGRPDGDTSAA
jgi:GrpB-like predicted nucleotidyltransferase (UPF0157 family)